MNRAVKRAVKLRRVIFHVFTLKVAAPGPPGTSRHVLQHLVAQQKSHAKVLLLALTSAFVHRAHAALKAEVRSVSDREVAWGSESTFGKSTVKSALDPTAMGNLCKRWYCARSQLQPLAEWPRVTPRTYPHETTQLLSAEVGESLPRLMSEWSAVQSTPDLLKAGTCVECLKVDAESQRLRQCNVVHGLHKQWLEHVAPKCAALVKEIRGAIERVEGGGAVADSAPRG